MKRETQVVKRLSINLPADLYEKLVEITEKKNITVTGCITQLVYELIKKEIESE